MSMSMTPDIFFDGFVLGNYGDFAEHPDSVRHGFNAAMSASHMADHYYEYAKRHKLPEAVPYRTLGEFLKHLSDATGGTFGDIRSIANAYKHLYPDSDHSTVSSAGTIETVRLRRTDVLDVFESYQTAGATVCYTTKDRGQFELLPVLERVVDFWATFLRESVNEA